MQFRKHQRAELTRTWNTKSWFFRNLGEPAREIVEKAYGLKVCTPAQRTLAQEDITLVMSIFAAYCGCDKSHVTHAFLSGSVDHLHLALKRLQVVIDDDILKQHWVESFRRVNTGDYQ